MISVEDEVKNEQLKSHFGSSDEESFRENEKPNSEAKFDQELNKSEVSEAPSQSSNTDQLSPVKSNVWSTRRLSAGFSRSRGRTLRRPVVKGWQSTTTVTSTPSSSVTSTSPSITTITTTASTTTVTTTSISTSNAEVNPSASQSETSRGGRRIRIRGASKFSVSGRSRSVWSRGRGGYPY